jgi:hypothetical protein
VIDCSILLNVVADVVIVLDAKISSDADGCVVGVNPMLVWVDDIEEEGQLLLHLPLSSFGTILF